MIFTFFTVVGYGVVLAAARAPEAPLILLSPTIGAAVVVLPTMLANYLGMPVQFAGPPLALVLLVASGLIIARSPRPKLPRWFFVIAWALLLGLVLNAWPMFIYGRNWMAFMNGDMQTYVNTAANIFARGFLVPPDAHAYIQQRTMTIPYEIRYVLLNHRSGAENLIAFWMSLLGRNAYEVYMPLIVAAQLALISAATALVYDVRHGGRIPIATAIVLSCSPLMTLGVAHQLLPQVLGIALLIATLLLVCSPKPIKPLGAFLPMASLSGAVLAGFCAVYPESAPILGATVFFYYAVAIVRRTINIPVACAWIGSTSAVAILALNAHITTVLQMIILTLSFSTGSVARWSAFSAYLIPSGLADVFGFSAVAQIEGSELTLAIISGAALFLVTLVAMIALLRRGRMVGFGLAAMLLGVPLLFVHKNGFGLYKLAMYVQPFLVSTLLSWWGDLDIRAIPPIKIESS